MPEPQANMDNGGRWDHVASEGELQRALNFSKAGKTNVVEAPNLGMTWIQVPHYFMIIRAGAMGGSVNNIEGGWVYENPFSMMLDWNEIKQAASAAQGG